MRALITLADITDEDRIKEKEYIKSRNLYNRYSESELSDWTKVDLYAALDLDGFRYKEIPEYLLKQAIRRKSTMYHPQRNSGRNVAFILIKNAELIFSTPKYKKLYDSVRLDESLPADREYSLDEFMEVFGPVFERNGIFSDKQPVPELCSAPDVFYRFWNNFKTTRMYEDPEDVFEQRGYNRRHNADMKKDVIQKRRNADAVRIGELVRLAYRRDPRIKRVAPTTAPWTDAESKSLMKFNMLLGKHKDKYTEIAKKLNHLYNNKRSANEIKMKIESNKK